MNVPFDLNDQLSKKINNFIKSDSTTEKRQ